MAPRVLHHLAFRTHDVERLATFYRDIVGLAPRPGGTEGRSVWFALGEGIVMIERAEAGETLIASTSMDLVAFRVTADERRSAHNTLAAAKIVVEGETTFTTYFRDPDGRRVAFSHYPEEPST